MASEWNYTGTDRKDTFTAGEPAEYTNWVISGKGGNDRLTGSEGRDLINGGGAMGNQYFVQTASGTLYVQVRDDDLIRCLDGDDTVSASAGNDTIDGGLGQDLFSAETSHSYYHTDFGEETQVIGTWSNSTVAYIKGSLIDLSAGTYRINYAGQKWSGAALDVTVRGRLIDFEQVLATAGDDLLKGTDGDNIFKPNGGHDTIRGGAGYDTIVYFQEWGDSHSVGPASTPRNVHDEVSMGSGFGIVFNFATKTATDTWGYTDSFTGNRQ
jgi:Ca2+-binding RTX toxin-like protein